MPEVTNITAQDLAELLNWPDVREELHEHGLRTLRVVPGDRRLASLDLCFTFGEEGSCLQSFGCGNWHYHPHDIDDAIEVASRLISRETCIVEVWVNERRLGSCGLQPRDGIPPTLARGSTFLVRSCFGLAPEREQIDFTRYFRGKRSYVEWNRKAELEALWRSNGMIDPQTYEW